ncbi:SRPBCC family protein [Paraglaciecola sp.]|uniref:SRPBCC family protein n=1 Tax=Paraglaciecola sp. TaxID=1920173 RepID=UPI003EF6C876
MECNNTIRVTTSAQRAWHVLADQFGDAAEWATTVETSKLVGKMGVGAVRACKTRAVGPFPANYIEEEITQFDPENRSYSYKLISGLPPIFSRATNTWSIRSISDNECEILSNVILEPKIWLRPLAWLFPLLIKRDLKHTFEELGFFIERGEAHPRKLATIGNK